jgi:hypothetical protein
MDKRIFLLIVCLLLVSVVPSWGANRDGAQAKETKKSSAYSGYYRDPSRAIEMRKKKITHAQRKEAAARFKAARDAARAKAATPNTAFPSASEGGTK